jgi:uncharacterized protein
MILDSEFEFSDAIASPLINQAEYQSMKNYRAHGQVSVYDHSLFVAERAYLYAKKRHLDLDYTSLVRGALLHDYYLYDWHKKHKGHRLHGFCHPAWALHNALLAYDLNPTERDIIRNHMFPLTLFHWPHSKEARLVSKMDHKEARVEMHEQRVPSLQVLVFQER